MAQSYFSGLAFVPGEPEHRRDHELLQDHQQRKPVSDRELIFKIICPLALSQNSVLKSWFYEKYLGWMEIRTQDNWKGYLRASSELRSSQFALSVLWQHTNVAKKLPYLLSHVSRAVYAMIINK